MIRMDLVNEVLNLTHNKKRLIQKSNCQELYQAILPNKKKIQIHILFR